MASRYTAYFSVPTTTSFAWHRLQATVACSYRPSRDRGKQRCQRVRLTMAMRTGSKSLTGFPLTKKTIQRTISMLQHISLCRRRTNPRQTLQLCSSQAFQTGECARTVVP
ncbi:hypothetical protein CW304_32925 [Bacillus sp. UFRGS-B20]|nr:hypothetical protein CW304_32925 [Bacillus sp. UFRGS-B20]